MAVLAARKKFIISRIGDLFLLIAIGLIYKAFGSFEFEQIFRRCVGSLSDYQATLVSWSGVFFAVGAMTKSAQVPFHFWLPETMETPTPVSALMHAGIINAGGFLILRLSPVMGHAAFASLMLASIGALTAVLGSLSMVTQNDIKKKLAYSTISQMGFMMFACGIGAYTVALFHIVSHSLYKAYAFLSTGDLVEENKKISISLEPLSSLQMAVIIITGLGIVFSGLNFREGNFLPEFTYVSILFLGFSQNAESLEHYSNIKWMAWSKIGLKLTLALLVFIVFEWGLRLHVGSLLSLQREILNLNSPLFVVCLMSYLVFAVGFWLGNTMMNPINKISKTIYFYMWNGGYFGVRSTAFLNQFWPLSRKVRQ
jgi:NAD(P)H-quinone oxidoreductase subunit 5